tara:strand:+ start:1482 stop:2318 length:837 start_codon:yes stop_codon:yes gene_type:complete
MDFDNDEDVVYTRYLYNKNEARQNLFISLLESNMEHALFWMFELYYSGFEEETLDYLIEIYHLVYKKLHPKLEKYIESMNNKWRIDTDICAYGNIVATLSTRNYDLQDFCKIYLHIQGKQQESSKPRFIVSLKDTDIEKYKTDIITEHKYRILQKQCAYQTRNEFNRLFNILLPCHNDLYQIYRYHWLYYAYRSPVWKKRIDEYNGTPQLNSCKIIFENDDDLEQLCEQWGYDPDEQSIETQYSCIGIPNIKQVNIKYFCSMFNFKIKTIKKSEYSSG